jgi:hypothetical protein
MLEQVSPYVKTVSGYIIDHSETVRRTLGLGWDRTIRAFASILKAVEHEATAAHNQ